LQYELRQQVVEPERQAFSYLIRRFGDRPASRYEEATVDVQATENFHYRPTWDTAHELYDVDYSVLKLTDPYGFLDPRQLYYAPYVTTRAAHYEAFANTLDYLTKRDLLGRLPDAWRDVLVTCVLPLRHYESGAQLLSSDGARFAYGTSVEQCCTFAAFDRIGNAQLLTLLGMALGDGADTELARAKQAWLDEPALQGLRRTVERLLTVRDWGTTLVALDLVDRLLYPVLYRHLDEAALLQGAGAWSLVAQHFAKWFDDQRKWIDHLVKTWLADPEHGASNGQALTAIGATWLPEAVEAVGLLAGAIDARLPEAGCADVVTGTAVTLTETFAAMGGAA
jgi:phenol/toluene 2-monooxygenase (NADH) P1/A1